MKRLSFFGGLLLLFAVFAPTVEANEHARFLGRCQQCTRPIYAYWQPVECTNGCVEYRWVTHRHNHCRPAYKGDKRNDFYRSHWFNPANKKRNKKDDFCGPFAVNHVPGHCGTCK